MGQLDELYNYKYRLMKDLLTDERIVHLIDEDVILENAKSLAYTQVYPYEYIPETIQEGKTYVCFDVDIEKSLNRTYLLPIINIWIITHKSKLRLPEGGARTDAICSAIADRISGSRHYGLGELDLYSVRRFASTSGFQGKVMTFHATDFNRLSTARKPTPSSRRNLDGDD